MTYMRGQNYIWSDGESVHIWCADGYDLWDKTAWHLGEKEDEQGRPTAETYVYEDHLRDGKVIAAGVSVRKDVLDQFVMMRLAQLVYEGKVAATIDAFLAPGGGVGNTGGMMLEANADVLKEALSGLTLKPAPPYVWPKSER